MSKSQAWWALAVFGSAVIAIGCGGSQSSFGGNSSGSWTGGGLQQGRQNQGINNNAGKGGPNQPGGPTAGATGGIPVYLTDDSDAPLDHAYVRIYKVELFTSKSSIAVFESNDGIVLDLRTLRDKSGPRYAFFGVTSLSSSELVRAQIEVGREMSVIQSGQSAPETRRFGDALAQGKDRARLSLNLPKKDDLTALVLDFDFAKAQPDPKKGVLVTLREGDPGGLSDLLRHEPVSFTGKVGSLSGKAPDASFALNLGQNRTLRVAGSPETASFDAKGDEPKLANNAQAEVRGVFDAGSKTFLARSIAIVGKVAPDEVTGLLTNKDGKDLAIATTRSDGPLSTAHEVPILLDGNAVFLGKDGRKIDKEEFLKQSSEAIRVEADGQFDNKTGAFKATRLKLESPAGASPIAAPKAESNAAGAEPKENEAKTPAKPKPEAADLVQVDGSVVSIDKEKGVFRVNSLASQSKIESNETDVAIDAKTKFYDLENKLIDREAFFAALAAGAKVTIRGSVGGGKIVATAVRFVK